MTISPRLSAWALPSVEQEDGYVLKTGKPQGVITLRGQKNYRVQVLMGKQKALGSRSGAHSEMEPTTINRSTFPFITGAK